MPELRKPSPPALDSSVEEGRLDTVLHIVVDMVEDASEQHLVVSTSGGDWEVDVHAPQVSLTGLHPNSMYRLSSRASAKDMPDVESDVAVLWTRPTDPTGRSVCMPMGGNVGLFSWALESVGSSISPPLFVDIDAEVPAGARNSLARAARLEGSIAARWVPGLVVEYRLYSDLGEGARNEAFHPLRALVGGAAMLPPSLVIGDSLKPSAPARVIRGDVWSRSR